MGCLRASEKSYQYTAYGLNILSHIPCPELLQGIGTPDVTIRYGVAPDYLPGAEATEDCYQAAPGQFLLTISGVAKYLVSSGQEILIDRAPTAEDDELRLFLLGSAFGALLHQRGLLPLHGSAFEAYGGCVAILGDSGLGKSTLAGAFSKRGYRIMADDVSVVSVNGDGVPVILPGYPQLKLWPDAARRLGETPELLPRVDTKLEKHCLPFQEGFYRKPVPLHRVYVLSTNSKRNLVLRSLKGVEKLTVLINNTYRVHFLYEMGAKALHFKQCVAVAKHAVVTKVTRPREPFLLDELAELLEQDFS